MHPDWARSLRDQWECKITLDLRFYGGRRRQMGKYAQQTDVAPDRSRAEIERILRRYKATGFMYGWGPSQAQIAFEMRGRRVLFKLPLPDRGHPLFTRTDTGRARSPTAGHAAFDQAVRQRWRALALVIKAKLAAVDAGISVFDEEFLSYIVLPDGHTVGDHLIPQVAHSYESGAMPPLLPSPD